jgi:hypothetical protein
MSCECNRPGGPWITVDPECPVHGVDGYEEKLERAEARIAELEAAIRDELIRRSLLGQPQKFEFARQHGMTGGLDEVHAWMTAVSDRLKNLVDG